jgi:hypothetical protein
MCPGWCCDAIIRADDPANVLKVLIPHLRRTWRAEPELEA